MNNLIKKWIAAKDHLDWYQGMVNLMYGIAQKLVSIPPDSDLRPATPEDIVVGNIIWYKDGDDGPFWMDVDEVINPNDQWKAFYSTEGSSYGLDGAFVEK